MKRLAIIPARGGSKRILKKNIKNFCGKPIISYSINTAIKSELFHTIHVSTDCAETASVVEKMGLKIDFMRDPDLADDDTPIMPVIKWVLENYQLKGMFFDEVVLIMACAPLIDYHDLKNASKLMNKSTGNCPIISVSSYPAPIEWAFDMDTKGKLAPLNPGMFKIKSQDLKKRYFDTGSFIFLPIDYILNSKGAGDDNSFLAYELKKFKAIDIDEEEDWEFAEQIMKSLDNL